MIARSGNSKERICLGMSRHAETRISFISTRICQIALGYARPTHKLVTYCRRRDASQTGVRIDFTLRRFELSKGPCIVLAYMSDLVLNFVATVLDLVT